MRIYTVINDIPETYRIFFNPSYQRTVSLISVILALNPYIFYLHYIEHGEKKGIENREIADNKLRE